MVDVTLYHTWDELIAEFDALQAAYPQLMTKQVVGYSTNGKPIFLYAIGNPNGGRVMFSATHANELVGPELFLRYTRYLLENQEPGISDRILERNLTLIVPHFNVERYKTTRTNQGSRKNPNGVDLNRNFEASWRTDCVELCTDCCANWDDCQAVQAEAECIGAKDPRLGHCYKKGCNCYWSPFVADYNYRGIAPLSEKESQVMHKVFVDWKPRFMLDYHCWAGPYLAKASWRGRNKAIANGLFPDWTATELAAYHDQVMQMIKDRAAERGVHVYSTTTLGVCGSTADDACGFGGAISFLIEGHNARENGSAVQCPYEELDSKWFPAFVPIAIVFSQECETKVKRTLTYNSAPIPVQATIDSTSVSSGSTIEVEEDIITVSVPKIKVTASASSGYVFDHWELDGESKIENPLEITMDKDYMLKAIFRSATPFEQFWKAFVEFCENIGAPVPPKPPAPPF